MRKYRLKLSIFACTPRVLSDAFPAGLDLLSLDGSHAVGCWNASVSFKEVRRFLRMARWVYKAREIALKGRDAKGREEITKDTSEILFSGVN